MAGFGHRALLTALVVVSGCTGGRGGDDEGAAQSTTTTVRRSTAVEAPLRVGQCGDVPRLQVGGALDPATVTDRPCTEPHAVEIGAVFDFPAGPDVEFPGVESVDGYATDECVQRFEPYVGAPYDTSTLDVLIVAPDEAGWEEGDRRIACVLYHVDFQPITASARASGI